MSLQELFIVFFREYFTNHGEQLGLSLGKLVV